MQDVKIYYIEILFSGVEKEFIYQLTIEDAFRFGKEFKSITDKQKQFFIFNTLDEKKVAICLNDIQIGLTYSHEQLVAPPKMTDEHYPDADLVFNFKGKMRSYKVDVGYKEDIYYCFEHLHLDISKENNIIELIDSVGNDFFVNLNDILYIESTVTKYQQSHSLVNPIKKMK